MNSEIMDKEFRSRLERLIGEEKPFPWSKRIGLTPGVFNRMWNDGIPPKADALMLISEKTGVSLNWLVMGSGPMMMGQAALVEERLSGGYATGRPAKRKETPPGTDESDYVQIPRYEIQASAGGGAVVQSEQVVDFLHFRADWVKNALGIPVQHLALINVLGDSMEPTLSDGDLILIDLSTYRVQDNAVYVLKFNGALLVKRIQRKLDGSVIVASDNKIYDPEVVSGEMLDTLNVVGRVVWCGRRM